MAAGVKPYLEVATRLAILLVLFAFVIRGLLMLHGAASRPAPEPSTAEAMAADEASPAAQAVGGKVGWRPTRYGRFTVRVAPGPQTVLVLDLDETLVHSRTDMLMHTDAGTPHPADGAMVVTVRPHAVEFLRRVASMFDRLVVFTAGTRPYAEPIIDALEASSGVRIAQRLYRDDCTPIIRPAEGVLVGYAKDLRRVWPDLSRVLLLDNTPSAYSLQPRCGVPIESFFGDPADRALLDVLPVLASRRLAMVPLAP